MPRAEKPKKKSLKHEPLQKQIESEGEGVLRTAPRAKPVRKAMKGGDDESDDEGKGKFVDGRMGQKLMRAVAEQQRDIEQELDEDFEQADEYEDAEEQKRANGRGGATKSVSALARFGSKQGGGGNGDDDDDDDNDDAYGVDDDEEGADVEADFEDLTEADRRALEAFMPSSSAPRRNLADLVMTQLQEKEAILAAGGVLPTSNETMEKRKSTLHPKVIHAYSQLGQYLKHYTSGKIPKLLKIVPKLKNWEEVLYFAGVDKWTSQAICATTKFFASNLNPILAQRYYNLVLLPRIQQDIEENKKLNYHLYEAVRRAVFKPTAFYKGLILPLAENGCSAREAVIFAGMLSKFSIPGMHSAVALLKLTQLPYNGPTILFIKTLLNKKYALPVTVIAALCDYFVNFVNYDGTLPVMWHQAVLAFVQRYKLELSDTQKDALRFLIRKKVHPAISEEIRNEILSTRVNEGATAAAFTGTFDEDGDDGMGM